MNNYLITISYDGKNYHGWQIQKNALAVQEVFQNALEKIINTSYDLKGCSRTDSGVHANMYCISLLTERDIPPERLKGALNGQLPTDIVVYDCKKVNNDFHARYSCVKKQYIYKIWNNELRNPFLNGYALHYRYQNCDEVLLNEAAKQFIGCYDFSAFCTYDKSRASNNNNFVRTVYDAKVERFGDMVIFTVEADGFLYNMVRIMVGTLLKVAQGAIKPEDIIKIINSKTRKNAGPTAPPCGLYLNKVFYEMDN